MPVRLTVLVAAMLAPLGTAEAATAEPAGTQPAPSQAAPVAPATTPSPTSQPTDEPSGWDKVPGPKPGPALVFGGYSAGCVQGTLALPALGKGFRVARPERHRLYGHPLLLAFIRGLAKQATRAKVGTLWIGDLSQARGGPAPTGHASHQTGLDVDLWFGRKPGKKVEPIALVDLAKKTITAQFGKKVLALLRAAATSAGVERIFVNPVIKQALCEKARGDRAWLQKIRPWWGHHDHFHVRLSCPADSPDCEAQSPLPPGDGCAELDWWFQSAKDEDRAKAQEKYQAKVGARPPLPDKCRDVLAAP